MVSLFLVLLLLLIAPASSQAITADELRALSDVWESNARERAGRIQTDHLNKLIPKAPEKKKTLHAAEGVEVSAKPLVKKETERATSRKERPIVLKQPPRAIQKAAVKPKLKKYQMAPDTRSPSRRPLISSPEAEAALFPGLHDPRLFQQNIEGQYFPPPRQGGFGALTDAVKADKARLFGIRIGTWISGVLKRPASNSEPGLIELYTTESVSGRLKSLPSGTTLFAQKSYNGGTKKLDLIVEKGITPEGLEFEIKGLVFDLKRTAGLMGRISTDSSLIVERSTSKGLLAAGSEAVNALAGSTVVGAAGSAAAESFLSDSAETLHERQRLKQTIQSAPQALLIRVEETF